MKTLVAFYSRTGNTKKVSLSIAKILKADIDEIIDLKDRRGIRGWLGGGKDAFFKKSTTIKNKKDASKYGMVVIGTPVWVGTMVPAVRSYLSKYKLKKVAFFCTCGSHQAKTFRNMEQLSNKPLATLDLKDKKIGDKESEEKIKDFCKKLG